MKSTFLLILGLIFLALVPSPYIKTTSNCTTQEVCEHTQEFGFGDSLAVMVYKAIIKH